MNLPAQPARLMFDPNDFNDVRSSLSVAEYSQTDEKLKEWAVIATKIRKSLSDCVGREESRDQYESIEDTYMLDCLLKKSKSSNMSYKNDF